MRILALLAFVYLNLGAYCYEPSEPYCVNHSSTFEDEYRFKNCRNEVENYIEDLNKYLKCLANEVSQKGDEVVEKFNCRAQGNRYCY